MMAFAGRARAARAASPAEAMVKLIERPGKFGHPGLARERLAQLFHHLAVTNLGFSAVPNRTGEL